MSAISAQEPPALAAIRALHALEERERQRAQPLSPSPGARGRRLLSRLALGVQGAGALIALSVLALFVASVTVHGAGVLSLSFLTQAPPSSAEAAGGGIAPEIVGSAILIAIATAIALPLGVLIAIWSSELAGRGRLAFAVALALDLLNGMPTIVIGLFVFGILVAGQGQSGAAGAIALAIIMLPLIARATQEVLGLFPGSLREAAEALGVARWRIVRGVILPATLPAILTATVLSAARAAGETAPLILLSSVFSSAITLSPFGGAMPNIPVYIFSASEGASAYGFERAWGAALLLLLLILTASLLARIALARSTTRMARR
ncbi:MAG TPA: phosphate ABC transporter permease PstA [Solirubrobacteraceae bacterium]|nr:phosphate ABC transporter permease PstA [Solirubrobacteraceae bacterium]